MNPTTKKIIKYITGWSLIILGIIGLFVPFLQGIAMILAGLVVLENKYAIKLVNRIKDKWYAWKNRKKKK